MDMEEAGRIASAGDALKTIILDRSIVNITLYLARPYIQVKSMTQDAQGLPITELCANKAIFRM